MKTVIIVGVVLAVVAILIAAGIDNYKKKMALRDTQRRFIETYEFPSILRAKVQRHYPALNAEQIGMILEGLRQWFLLIGNYPGKRFGMPSKAVDAAWHEFILMTRDYDAFCKQAFGEYLHHSPNSGGENAERERDALAQTYALAPIASMSMTGLVAGAAVGIGLFNLDHALGIEGGHHYTDAELSELTQRHAAMASSGGESGVGVSVDGSGRDNHSGHGIDGGGDSGGGDGGGCGGGCGS